MNEPTPFYQLPAFADLVRDADGRPPRVVPRSRVAHPRVRRFESSKWINPGWETFTVTESRAHPDLEGRSLASIAHERGCTPFDVLADIALDDNLLARFEVTFANNDEAGITMLVQNEGCIMGLSDAGAHISQICDAVMPTDFLSSWVRDRQVMSLERGVRKLTGEIADVIGVDRGYVRVGSPADLVVIDLENLSTGPSARDRHARRRRALIADAPTGIDAVLVNGVPIRLDGVAVIDAVGRAARADPHQRLTTWLPATSTTPRHRRWRHSACDPEDVQTRGPGNDHGSGSSRIRVERRRARCTSTSRARTLGSLGDLMTRPAHCKLLTDAVRAKGAAAVKSGRAISCAHDFPVNPSAETPVPGLLTT